MENRLLEEYKDSSANMRHYANHSVAFLSLSLLLLLGYFQFFPGPNAPESQTAVSLFGLSMTILFWVMTESAHYLWGHFARRAAAIESQLKFEQYSHLPGNPTFCLRPVLWASVLMFLFTTGFWTYRILGIVIALVVCLIFFIIRILLLRFVKRLGEKTAQRARQCEKC